ncbi:hypothetical protein [Natronorubrum sulfidifaciens]|uniref:Uncharacterized protein n=1 Tax=Natronorubrum sulfidifaciens JCM 14089 TaxID=1230460 RepID=L9W832_9EURY|nr:hypothetical protein [Natronorubrum sulfidifaciens]ELY44478.1 hypothetical protein C495_11264 [Natronorubrum sulfidifaciens JCM 14089]
MGSSMSLPRTPIEWFMLGPLLVVLNVVVLLATNHPLPTAVAMGIFYGFAMALVLVIVATVWNTRRESGDGADAESAE